MSETPADELCRSTQQTTTSMNMSETPAGLKEIPMQRMYVDDLSCIYTAVSVSMLSLHSRSTPPHLVLARQVVDMHAARSQLYVLQSKIRIAQVVFRIWSKSLVCPPA